MSIIAIFESLIDKLTEFALEYGVIGLALGMFFESIGVPATSVVLELASGTLIAQGRTTFIEAVVISTAGLALGSTLSYYIGYFGIRAFGKVNPDLQTDAKKSRAHNLLIKHGEITILFAQLFGATRTWVSLPAGAMGINFPRFLLYTIIGGAIYCSLVIGLSVVLTDVVRRYYSVVISYLNLPFFIVLAAIVALMATWIWKTRRGRERKAEESHGQDVG